MVPYTFSHRTPRCPDNQARQGHINLRKFTGTPAGCLWNTWRDKLASTGRYPKDFLLLAVKKLTFLPGHQPGHPEGFQKLHLILYYVLFLLPRKESCGAAILRYIHAEIAYGLIDVYGARPICSPRSWKTFLPQFSSKNTPPPPPTQNCTPKCVQSASFGCPFFFCSSPPKKKPKVTF